MAPVVATSCGRLSGVREGPVDVFRGIPYAAPPVDELRWRSPQPAGSWTGDRDATSFGPIAPQDISRRRLAKRGQTMGEDCLSLNVWTPGIDGRSRPVVVFLHGGGVVAGSGSAPLLNGDRLSVRGDLVVVTINFRLGALGSLYAPGRLVAGEAGTNLAFRDQLAALLWVRNEIGAFGGNPDDVTVMGQSSGAVATACMLTSPAGHGLFDRAILQSGGLERVRSPEAAATVARRFLAALDDSAEGLYSSVERILAAQATIPTGFVPPVGPFHHAVDGEVIPEHPLSAIVARPSIPVPILVGTTRDEWSAFDATLDDDVFDEAYVRSRAASLLDADTDVDEVLDLYRADPRVRNSKDRGRAIAGAMVTDFHFAAPTEQFARAHAAHGNSVFRYELGVESPRPGLGACHDICLPLVFGTMERAPALVGEDAQAKMLSRMVQDRWIEFVHSDPKTPVMSDWPVYEANRRTTMLLGLESGPVEQHRADQLSVWEGRYPIAGT